ncbi:hypothetical protein AABB24_000393, partial [Solanum stoloniferum]
SALYILLPFGTTKSKSSTFIFFRQSFISYITTYIYSNIDHGSCEVIIISCFIVVVELACDCAAKPGDRMSATAVMHRVTYRLERLRTILGARLTHCKHRVLQCSTVN